MNGADVVATARTWKGTPWLHQAAVKGVGTDCIGLIAGVGIELGLPAAVAWTQDAAAKGYGRVPDPRMLMASCLKYLDPIPKERAGVGDILVLRFDREPQHFAILSSLQPRQVIHAYAAARKVCENGIDGEWRTGKTWRSLIVAAFRYRGIE